jgi:4-nitrophenyl phosphatase
MVGDRLETDILGANQAGLQSALLLTGVSTEADVERTGIKPDGLYADLPTLLAAWS